MIDRTMPPDENKEPSFMDVGALVAKARDPGSAPPQPEAQAAPPAHGQHADEAAPAPPVRQSAPLRPNPIPARRSGGSGAFKLAVAALVLVVVAVVGLFALPQIVRQRAIAIAREAGLDITIEAVGVGTDGVRLRGVDVAVPHASGVTAKVEEVHLASFSLRDVRVRGADLRLDGSLGDLQTKLEAVLAANRARFAGTPETPHRLSVSGARFTWQSGARERVEAGDIGVDLESRGAGVEEVRGTIGEFQVTSSKASFGPWSSSFERSATNARVRVMFDPPVPDGPSALAVWTKAGGTEVTELKVDIARSSFKHLGIVPGDLGLPADTTSDVQVSVLGTLAPTARSTFTFDATLYGLRVSGFGSPVDVHLEGSASSAGGKSFELEKTSVTLGPFVAGVSGTVTPHARGARIDAMFKTVPMSCAQLARAEAKTMGPLVATLQALGESTGALRVTGTVNASGVVKLDTAEPDRASVSWLAKETCGVSIFGM